MIWPHGSAVLGVPHTDPLFAELQGLQDVPSHYLREVEHFFATYKQLEGVHIETQGWVGREAAIAEIAASIRRFGHIEQAGLDG
jgi:inorganic pyrophosphatase